MPKRKFRHTLMQVDCSSTLKLHLVEVIILPAAVVAAHGTAGRLRVVVVDASTTAAAENLWLFFYCYYLQRRLLIRFLFHFVNKINDD